MKNKTDERISALFDGELSRFETRRWTNEVLSKQDLSERVTRYQMLGDVLREELPAKINLNFCEQVASKIADVSIEPYQKRREWLKPAGGLAVAASVALVSLLGLRVMTTPEADPVAIASLSGEAQQLRRELPAATQPTPANPATRLPITTVNNPLTPAADADASRELPKVRQLSVNQPFLTNYIATHSQYADPSSMMSHIRLVGYELNPQQ